MKLGLHTFSYPIHNYQPAIEHNKAISQALTNAKASQAKEGNLHQTPESQHRVRDKVLLYSEHFVIKHVLQKMKPGWIRPVTILSAHYNHHKYSLDQSLDQSLNLKCNTFSVRKVKTYVNNNSTLFPHCQLAKPGPVSQDSCRVEKFIEY